MATAVPTIPTPLAGARPLYDSAAMGDADRRAVDQAHIPSIVLMERAGLEIAREILTRHGTRGSALVLVGAGNNGGDGYVVARHLAEAGWEVDLRTPVGQRAPAGDAGITARQADALGLRPQVLNAPPPQGALVVDALLGTGARGTPRDGLAEAIASVAQHDPALVVSVDVPSGVEADTGRVGGSAIRAGLTVTLHGDKPGLHVAPGRLHAGEVLVADIGIPSLVTSLPVGWLVGQACLALIAGRSPDGDKYRAGSLAVVAGASGMLGAAALVVRGAQRAGAGLVLVALASELQEEGAAVIPVEAVRVSLRSSAAGALDGASLNALLEQQGRIAAAVVGPGLGRAPEAASLVARAMAALDCPLVLDADGLWSTSLAEIATRHAPTVITPHAGEAARLLGIAREEVEGARLDAAQALAEGSGHVALLKGPGTIVAAPGQAPLVVAEGGPDLATAGSGDVLCGVIGALLAAGVEARVAAALGACWHARAGALGGHGSATTAGDIAESLPAAVGW